MKTLKITAGIMLVATAMAGLMSCDDKYEMELPLALTQHNLDLNQAGGDLHVLVYSTDKWSVRLLDDKDASWCQLGKTSGEKNGEFLVKYSANNGVERSTAVELSSKNGLVDTLVMVQAGYVGMGDVTLILMRDRYDVDRPGGSESIELRTNLDLALDCLDAVVIYDDGTEEGVISTDGNPGWITNIKIDREEVTFDVAPNASGSDRKATLRVFVPNLPNYRNPDYVSAQPYRVATESVILQSN